MTSQEEGKARSFCVCAALVAPLLAIAFRVNCCWPWPAQLFMVSSPVEHMTYFRCVLRVTYHEIRSTYITTLCTLCTTFRLLISGLGHAVAQSLRHYATSRNVTGSRPDVANKLFSIYLIPPAALYIEVHSACSRNEYQKHINNVSGE
jgi:hypothetical protein